jgi:ribonucleotide reductase alpha subunit
MDAPTTAAALGAGYDAPEPPPDWFRGYDVLDVLPVPAPSGKKLDETYKLAWLRGLKTTYYLRSMGATHAEKSTVKTGQLNAVPTDGPAAAARAHPGT